MKSKFTIVALALLAISTLSPQLSTALAQGTAFTYQGRLNSGSGPATGSYDLTFSLFNTNTGGVAIVGPVTNSATGVTNGLFTTAVDFGAGVFTGNGRWLQIAVRTNGSGSFTNLAPRQLLTPTPYAIFATTASNVSGTVSAAQLNGTLSGDGAGLTNLNASQLKNGVVSDSVLPGFQPPFFAALAGGANYSGFGYGYYSSEGGGLANTATGYCATVSGGGGRYDTYQIFGGSITVADFGSSASGDYSTVPGGFNNTASGDYSFAAGNQAAALNNGSFVWNDGSDGTFSSTGNNQFAVHAAGGVLLASDLQLGTNSSNYHHFTLGGGNSFGYLYGSYGAFGDGIHLGYNIYYDASGLGHVANSGGATSRITAGYGVIKLDIGGVNAQPTADRLVADSSGVTVYGTFNNSSDRNAKQDFAAVSPGQILDKVLQLPVSEWSYKTDATTRHLGPMGQDFYSTFNLGTDEKHIAPIDEGGVALAAIQGLNQKLETQSQELAARSQKLESENTELKKKNESLEKRLEALEQVLLNQSPN